MSLNERSVILPSVSIVLPLSASKEDAKAAAANRISGLLKGGSFEMLTVDLLEEGDLRTPNGVVTGKRYQVSFRKTENVVFLHPDYYRVMEEYTKQRQGRR